MVEYKEKMEIIQKYLKKISKRVGAKISGSSRNISQVKNGVCEISQALKKAAKYFRNTKLSSPGCKVGFHLEVSSSLLAAWFVHRQKEKHLTVQKCCEILATKG